MSEKTLSSRRREFLRDTEKFLNANLDNPEAAWLLSSPTPELATNAQADAKELAVFVGGNLYLEYEIRIDMPFVDWLAALQSGCEKVRHRWAVTRCDIGGFPAYAARAAHAKGAAIDLGAALSRKRPRVLEKFLGSHNIHTESAVTYDGPMSHTLELIFTDGTHHLLVDPGPETPPVTLAPRRRNFDVILIDPGALARRRHLRNPAPYRSFTA